MSGNELLFQFTFKEVLSGAAFKEADSCCLGMIALLTGISPFSPLWLLLGFKVKKRKQSPQMVQAETDGVSEQ